jgi:MtfA peptidase
MFNTVIVLSIVAIAIAYIWFKPVLVEIKRRKQRNRPFPLTWQTILEGNIYFYQKLPESLQKRLRQHINVFLAEKQFIGCAGLQITEEIKVIIAAHACLLSLSQKEKYYPNLQSILVYPTAYLVNATVPFSGFLVEERQEVRLGESWDKDRIVLAWEQIQHDLMNWQDGHNVIFHEFAHQLDGEDGSVNGVPNFDRQSDYISWARVFEREYNQLRKDIELDLPTVISEYGATNPVEFFAVATETFFEKSRQMQAKHPELHEELKRYFKLNPLEWME